MSRKDRMKYFLKKKQNYSWIIFCFLGIVLLLSVGFSAFNNRLFIEGGSAVVRVDKDVRIMGVRVDSSSLGVSLYEDYNTSNISMKVNLPSADSYLVYEVDVYNLGNVEMAIRDVSVHSEKLKVEFLDYALKDKLCVDGECSLGVKKKIKLKLSYQEGKFDAENTSMDVQVDFSFGQIFQVEYQNIEEASNFPSEVVEGDSLVLQFSKKEDFVLLVRMGGKVLGLGDQYTYQDNVFCIPNVSGNIKISLSESTLMKKKLINHYISSGKESDIPSYDLDSLSKEEKKNLFSNVATESGIYTTKGITGRDVIIFRGNVDQNYVQFGGYLWRILQIDEDGNLRLILDGTTGRSHYNSDSTINSVDEASSVLGFSSSEAKTSLDNWFNYLKSFSTKIVKTKFCNNFEYISKTSSGSGNVTNYFQTYQNVGPDADNYSPSLVCDSKYRFEANIGLISGEEYVLAGGAFDKSNTNFFLYNSSIYDVTTNTNDYFWTLSPAFHDEGRKNGDVMMVDQNGSLIDWTQRLLKGNYNLRPVITIDGNDEMKGDGTKDNPYSYTDISQTAVKFEVTDLLELNNNTYFIGNIGGKKNVDGLMSAIVSNTLKNVSGLLGKNTATFSSDKSRVINQTAVAFTFSDGTMVGDDASDGYYYYLKTVGGEYLKINDDQSIELTTEPTMLKIKLGDLESRSGQILIANQEESVYLNFYGAESGEGDDKFAGWTSVDENAYMVLYRLD